MKHNCLMVFCRYPRAGNAKTRLIPKIGAEAAATIQRELVEHTLRNLQPLNPPEHWLQVHYTDTTESEMDQWLRPLRSTLEFRPQSDGDLGTRMQAAFAQAFQSGFAKVICIGTDAPKLKAETIRQSLTALEQFDLVLGPAMDGGYTLIGLKRPAPPLFADIAWGGSDVLATTLMRAANLNLKTKLLEPLADIDRPEDLILWQPKISVIVPTLNEASHIAQTLERVQTGSNIEPVVCDGGSQDGTVMIAMKYFPVIITKPGRATQMNAGADRATGDYLLFLHADTLLPINYELSIRRIFKDPQVVAGAFRFGLTRESSQRELALRTMEYFTNLRARYLQLPYGDQALFIRRETFQALGGFPDQAIMEDFELVRRLRKLGKIVIADEAALTSPRRYLKHGIFRTVFANQRLVFSYLRGQPVATVARSNQSAKLG